MIKKMIIVSIVLVATLIACSSGTNEDGDGTSEVKNSITVKLKSTKQTIHNFGASDAWACQFVGQWPDEKRNQVADWLFSTENDAAGNPKGIGLTLWRFNIGAGSAAQNNISDEWRRTEGFLKDDLTYDWTKQSGQRWFLDAAKARGVNQLLGFTNSPPVQLTKNGKAYSGNGEEANIDSKNYLKFAQFLIEVKNKLEANGTPLNYLSPFNEPQWDWTGNGQEGSPYKNAEIFAITKKLDSLLAKQNATTKIQIAEAGKLNYLYEKADKSTRGEQISQFFSSTSPYYMGAFTHVDKVISGHSYFTSAPVETLRTVRQNVFTAISASTVPLEFWQSEYCILGGQEEVVPEGKDLGIDPALYIARIIHHDLTVANASAWHWWLAVSAYDYKDGLIYVDKNKTDGKIEDSKMLWALGHYSRFIRPDYKRVDVVSETMNVSNAKGIMASAFVHEADKKLVIVIVNYAFTDTSFAINTEDGEVDSWHGYVTSNKEEENLKYMGEITTDTVQVPKRSIVTLVSSF